MNETLTHKQLFLYLLVIIISGFILGSVSLVYPFGRDQGIYAYIGKLILNGKIDYKYSYNLRPPGIHYVFALSQLILGESMFNMRIFDLGWQLLTACLLFLLAYKVTKSKPASLISAILYVFLYYRLDYWHSLQTDSFMNLPFILSILFLIMAYEESSKFKVFLSGFCFALTLLFKFTIILFLPLFIILMLGSKYFKNKKIKTLACYLGGIEMIVILTVSYYYLNNALTEFNDIQYSQIPMYARIAYETESIGFVLSNVLRLFTFSAYSPIILFSLLAYIYLTRRKMITFDKLLILIWIITCILSLILQWKFYTYHFIIIVPPLLIGTAIFISLIFKNLHVKFPKLIGISLTFVLILYGLISAKPYYASYADLLKYLEGKNNLEEIYIKKGVTADSVFTIKKTFEAVDFVKKNTDSKDKIYIWGIEPLIYYLSGRDCASRFTYNTPLYWRGESGKYRKEFINEIEANKPSMILIAKRDPMQYITGYNETSEQMLSGFPEFKFILENKYRYINDIAEFGFYKLDDSNVN